MMMMMMMISKKTLMIVVNEERSTQASFDKDKGTTRWFKYDRD